MSQAGTSHALSASAQAKALSGDLARMHLSLTSQVPHDSACICGPTGTTHRSLSLLRQRLPRRGPPISPRPSHQDGKPHRNKEGGCLEPGAKRKAGSPELVQEKQLQAAHCSSRPGCVGLGPGARVSWVRTFLSNAPELVLTFPPGLGSGSFPQQASHLSQFFPALHPLYYFRTVSHHMGLWLNFCLPASVTSRRVGSQAPVLPCP